MDFENILSQWRQRIVSTNTNCELWTFWVGLVSVQPVHIWNKDDMAYSGFVALENLSQLLVLLGV